MADVNQISNDLAEQLALALQTELKKGLVFTNKELLKSIKVKKVRNDYIIMMSDYWRQVEYLSNPFIRFTLNTKMDDILKKVTKEMSR